MILNRTRALSIMAEEGLDCLVASTQENAGYFCDVPVKGFVVFPASGEPAVVCRVLDSLVLAETPSWIKDNRFYGLFHILPSDRKDLSPTEGRMNEMVKRKMLLTGREQMDTLIATLKDKSLARGKIGLDAAGFSPFQAEKMSKALPDAKLADGTQAIMKTRAVKTEEEVVRLEKAAKITEAGFDAAERRVREGVTEKELAVGFREEIAKEEEAAIKWYRFPGGGRGAVALAPPSGYALKRGDLLQLHAAVIYRLYNSDIARGAAVGRPAEKALKIWNAIVAGQEKIVDNLKPGAKASDLFKVGVDTIRKRGLPEYERWHTGHGLGLGPDYDLPVLAPGDNTEIEENMVFSIETPYYEIGLGGMNLEDTGVVTKSGFRFFTSHRTELKIYN
ncbi:MAG: aminopeptidase P family protein [Nitrososphaerota archaeon]|nr:aminopeptidase P family protein [Nitrososphaerota archaeon]